VVSSVRFGSTVRYVPYRTVPVTYGNGYPLPFVNRFNFNRLTGKPETVNGKGSYVRYGSVRYVRTYVTLTLTLTLRYVPVPVGPGSGTVTVR